MSTALAAFDQSLDQAAILAKLQAGTDPSDDTARTDNGLYLGADGYLHMLPERVVTDGANIPVAFLPTTILGGAVTSYVQARVVNGIVYPPFSYVVTYVDEDGETMLGTESVYYGQNCVSAPTPTKQGYTFLGWAAEVNGTVDATLLENITANTTVYTVYEEETENGPENGSESVSENGTGEGNE